MLITFQFSVAVLPILAAGSIRQACHKLLQTASALWHGGQIKGKVSQVAFWSTKL